MQLKCLVYFFPSKHVNINLGVVNFDVYDETEDVRQKHYQTLVTEACKQLAGFCSFSVSLVGGSAVARKLNTGPTPPCAGLRAGFWRLLLSTMLEVLEAKLSRVLKKEKK